MTEKPERESEAHQPSLGDAGRNAVLKASRRLAALHRATQEVIRLASKDGKLDELREALDTATEALHNVRSAAAWPLDPVPYSTHGDDP